MQVEPLKARNCTIQGFMKNSTIPTYKINEKIINPLMPGGNKKVTRKYA